MKNLRYGTNCETTFTQNKNKYALVAYSEWSCITDGLAAKREKGKKTRMFCGCSDGACVTQRESVLCSENEDETKTEHFLSE